MLDPIDRIWSAHLDNIISNGVTSAPRDLITIGIFNATMEFRARRSVILNKYRGLNYRFMMAEAYWILSGDDTVLGINPWNPNIHEYSDNGLTFFGAYGPKVTAQMEYVAGALRKDSYTRQAVMTIWRESPPPTKDVPCTISLVFYRNIDELDCTVSMRSSDAWLGVPYDVFNFSMILIYVAGLVGIEPGQVVLNMVNAHLYEPQVANAKNCIGWEVLQSNEQLIENGPIVHDLLCQDPTLLMGTLELCRDSKNKSDCLSKWYEQ